MGLLSGLTVGTQPSAPLAANDERFAQLVISGAIDPSVASSAFNPKQVVHCFKPCSHVKRCALALPFPSHHEFAKRISHETWRQLNADLVEEMYQEAPFCLCPRKGINALLAFNLKNHRALYKVIAYYNRHLFHPMLIDAQIFAYHPGLRGKYSSCIYSILHGMTIKPTISNHSIYSEDERRQHSPPVLRWLPHRKQSR
jgi:hypothetical protein